MKKLCMILLVGIFGFVVVSCDHKTEEPDKVVVRFAPEDTADVDALFDFYIQSGIIFPAMLRCSDLHSADEPHTYDCLQEGCEIAHDYLADSTAPYFFMELNCLSGSCGNDIYFLQKKDSSFVILFNDCGTINQEIGPDTMVNGFRVIYYEKEGEKYRAVYNGKKFVSEPMVQALS